jgi:hypothetical protein
MSGRQSYLDIEEPHSERSSSSESEEQDGSAASLRRVALSLGILTIGAVFGIAAVGVYPSIVKADAEEAHHGTTGVADTEQALRRHIDEQILASPEQPPITVADFVKSRRLSDVAAAAFDATCPMFQSDCDLGEHFNSDLHKEWKTLHEHDPEFAKQLQNTTVTEPQQRIIMELLPLAHNKDVINLGQHVAWTVKRWAREGEKVVHEKVRLALADYSKEHGIPWTPPSNSSRPAQEGAWRALMNPNMLAMIGDDNHTDSKQLASRRLFQADPMVILQSVLGGGALLRLILLVFQILHKTNVVILPLWLKATIMWGNLIGGGIACIATILLWCPILFLQYWFNAWLMFSNQPLELDDWHIAPFGHWMRVHLPGFGVVEKRSLLAMDPRIAA